MFAPFLHDHGVYYVALQGKATTEAENAEAEKLNAAFRQNLEADKATYGKLIPTVFGKGQTNIAPAGSASC